MDEVIAAETETQAVETAKVSEEPKLDLAQVLARVNAQDDKLKNLERINSRKELENQKLREQLEDRDSNESLNKALLGVLAGQRGQDPDELEAEVRTRQPDLIKQFETLTAKQQQERRSERIKDYQERAIELGLKEDDPEYAQVGFYTLSGKWKQAEAVLAKREESLKPKEPVEPQTIIKSDPKEVEEAARRLLEERGQLKTETAKPSSIGAKWTMAQVKAMGWRDQQKNFPGGLTEIMERLSKGEITQ